MASQRNETWWNDPLLLSVIMAIVIMVCFTVGAIMLNRPAVPKATTPVADNRDHSDEGRALDSQIQLAGTYPVEPMANGPLSSYSETWREATERCWRGSTYVIFTAGAASVGSVVIMPDGKPLRCSGQ